MTRDDMTRYLRKPDGRQLARGPGKPFGCLFAFESETLLGIDT